MRETGDGQDIENLREMSGQSPHNDSHDPPMCACIPHTKADRPARRRRRPLRSALAFSHSRPALTEAQCAVSHSRTTMDANAWGVSSPTCCRNAAIVMHHPRAPVSLLLSSSRYRPCEPSGVWRIMSCQYAYRLSRKIKMVRIQVCIAAHLVACSLVRPCCCRCRALLSWSSHASRGRTVIILQLVPACPQDKDKDPSSSRRSCSRTCRRWRRRRSGRRKT